MHVSGRRFWLILLALTVLLRLPALYTEVLDTDEAGHAVHAWVWMDGGTPYVDFVDNKQPLVYVAYAAVFALFGRNLIALHWVTIPWLLLTAYLLSRLARRIWPKRPGAGRMAALLFTLFGTAYLEKDMLASNTEVLMNLPLVAAFAVLLDRPVPSAAQAPAEPGWRRLLGSGVLLGVATLLNLKAGIAAPVISLWLLWRGRLRGLTWVALLGAASLLPWALTAAWFAHQGALREFVYWNFLLNRKYASAGVPLWQIDLRRGILYGFPRLLLFLSATVVPWVAALLTFRPGPAAGSPGARPRDLLRLGQIWLLLSFVPVCMGGRLYGHYFVQLLPPLALVAAGPLTHLWGRLVGAPSPSPPLVARAGRRRRLAAQIAAAIFTLVPVVGLTVVGHVRIARGDLDGLRPEVAQVAGYVSANTCPDEHIFVWGYWSQIYYYARRLPAARFVYPQTLSGYVPGNPISLDPDADTSYYMVPEHWDAFFEDVHAHPPALLLDVAPAAIHFWEKYPMERFPRLQAFVRERYVREAVVAGVVVYRRRDLHKDRRCPN